MLVFRPPPVNLIIVEMSNNGGWTNIAVGLRVTLLSRDELVFVLLICVVAVTRTPNFLSSCLRQVTNCNDE